MQIIKSNKAYVCLDLTITRKEDLNIESNLISLIDIVSNLEKEIGVTYNLFRMQQRIMEFILKVISPMVDTILFSIGIV